MSRLSFRKATAADSDFLLQLRNDPLTRSMSRNTDVVDHAQHEAWLKRVLAENQTRLYVILADQKPVGQFRVDPSNEVSVALVPSVRGLGLGVPSIRGALREFIREFPERNHFTATVRASNSASHKIFNAAGFTPKAQQDNAELNIYELRYKKTLAIIQARLGSTRLPRKILKRLGTKSVLEHAVSRASRCSLIDQVVVATTTESEDDHLAKFCSETGIPFTRGSSADVLSRYYECATHFGCETVVRLTSDCPFLDPKVTDKVIREFYLKNVDYASNSLERTYPRGLDTEVFSYKALTEIHTNCSRMDWREHVTPELYRNDKYSRASVTGDGDQSNLRLTLDTPEDWQVIEGVYNALSPKYGDNFGLQEIIALAKDQPELFAANREIEQKKVQV